MSIKPEALKAGIGIWLWLY